MTLINLACHAGEFHAGNESMCKDILVAVIGTIVGGLVLTFCLFFINEYIIPKTNVTGKWLVKLTIQNTQHEAFKGLAIEHEFHLLQKGSEITGVGEKIKETIQGGVPYTFERAKRVRSTTNGYMDQKYLGKSMVFLNVIEDGRKRTTSSVFKLKIENEKLMTGTFVSTAADASGNITMTRG